MSELLPRDLGEKVAIARPTAKISALVAEVGFIDLPTGGRYISAFCG